MSLFVKKSCVVLVPAEKVLQEDESRIVKCFNPVWESAKLCKTALLLAHHTL